MRPPPLEPLLKRSAGLVRALRGCWGQVPGAQLHAVRTLSRPACTLPRAASTLPRAACTLPRPACTLTHAVSTLLHAACTLPRPACTLPRAASTLRRAACTLPRPACTLPRAVSTLLHAACTLPRPACTLPRAASTLPRAACTLPHERVVSWERCRGGAGHEPWGRACRVCWRVQCCVRVRMAPLDTRNTPFVSVCGTALTLSTPDACVALPPCVCVCLCAHARSCATSCGRPRATTCCMCT